MALPSISPPQHLVLRFPNWLGDAVMATPLLQDVKAHWPQVSMTVVCLPSIAALLKGNPHLNKLLIYDPHQRDKIGHFLQKEPESYDWGILLTNSFSSAWQFFHGKVQQRIGFKGNWRRLMLTHALPFPVNRASQHLVITYKKLLEPLGIPLSSTPPQLYIEKAEEEQIQTLLSSLPFFSKGCQLIGMNPGAAFGTAKCWLPERFRAVTLKLLENPNNVILYFGDQTSYSLVSDICKDLPERVVNLAGKTSLRELMALIKRCKVLLTNDSGPMHIAAALGTPLLALFGSTSATQTGPYHTGRIIHKHVACSPCYKRVCPIDFRCMKRIEVDEVYETLMQILAQH